jgi:hypothetical protein
LRGAPHVANMRNEGTSWRVPLERLVRQHCYVPSVFAMFEIAIRRTDQLGKERPKMQRMQPPTTGFRRTNLLLPLYLGERRLRIQITRQTSTQTEEPQAAARREANTPMSFAALTFRRSLGTRACQKVLSNIAARSMEKYAYRMGKSRTLLLLPNVKIEGRAPRCLKDKRRRLFARPSRTTG